MDDMEKALQDVLGRFQTDKEAALFLGDIPQANISKYRHKGYLAPRLRRELMKVFPHLRPPIRWRSEVRWSSEGQKRRMLSLARENGYDTIGDLIRAMADAYGDDKIVLTFNC